MSFLGGGGGGGGECSSTGNPLSRMKSHMDGDKSLQHDRIGSAGPAGASASFRSAPSAAPQDASMNGFLNGRPVLAHESSLLQNGIQPLHNGVVLRPHSASPLFAPGGPPPAMEHSFRLPQDVRSRSGPGPGFSPEEFAKFNATRTQRPASGMASPAMSTTAAHTASMTGPGPSMSMFAAHHGPMMMSHAVLNHMQQPSMSTQAQHHASAKGKERVVELSDAEWEEQFAKMELLDAEQQERGRTRSDDEDAEVAASGTNTGEQNHGDFESIWRGIQAENETAESMVDMLHRQDGRDDDEWRTADDIGDWNNFDESWNSWGQWNGNGGLESPQEYTFEQENVFQNQKNAFDEGMRIMREGGNLSLAALAFEAAVQKDPKHVEAWVQLGLAQAQNEKETAAIRALQQAVTLDPQHQAALMGLAVSYTNEAYEAKSLRTLERWLDAKYPDVMGAPKDDSAGAGADADAGVNLGVQNRQQEYERVTEAFIRAAQRSPDGSSMDPDVQVGLGVLFYGMEQYAKAVDCFEAALNSSMIGSSTQQEQVHLLWNRLGATLANSGDPERAIGAYQQALALRPHFVRARYNLGVSCMAMHCHEQAVQHLLSGLAMHKEIEKSAREKVGEMLGHNGKPVDEAVVNQMIRGMNHSDTLTETLRRAFMQMDRPDLVAKVEVGVDPDIFRGEFDF